MPGGIVRIGTLRGRIMQNRWLVLTVLFLARVAMGFQFQAVPALSPLMIDTYSVDLTAIGFLIALYLSPGLFISFPGGAIGARFGDKRVVVAGLVLMLLGGLVMALFPGWNAQVFGRLLAGVGGILLNVLMTKLVADHFSGREIATAMGIFVNSWPVGIALALIILPPIATLAGLTTAMWFVVLVVLAALILFVVFIRPPQQTAAQLATGGNRIGRHALIGIAISGSIWGLYNAALSMVFGFGPAMLVERGWQMETAASATSIVLWVAALSIPFGGLIADRLRRTQTVIAVSCLGFAATLVLAAETGSVTLIFALMGILGGLAPGPIMSLPSLVLGPQNRAMGMGIFYAIYYVYVVIGPIFAGFASDMFATTRAAFHAGAGMLVAAVLLQILFVAVARRQPDG